MKCVICTAADTHRQACHTCIRDTRRRLRELELYTAWLPAMLEPHRGDTGRRSPGYQSRPPARLDPIVMLDWRSHTNPIPVDEDRGLGLDSDDTPAWSILGTLHGLAQFVRGHGHPAPQTVTVAGELGYLLGRLDWCADQPWIDKLADDIRQLHAQARQLAGDNPNELGKCLSVDCGGRVYPARLRDPKNPGRHVEGARCKRCDRPYTGLDLAKLAIQRDREARRA